MVVLPHFIPQAPQFCGSVSVLVSQALFELWSQFAVPSGQVWKFVLSLVGQYWLSWLVCVVGLLHSQFWHSPLLQVFWQVSCAYVVIVLVLMSHPSVQVFVPHAFAQAPQFCGSVSVLVSHVGSPLQFL